MVKTDVLHVLSSAFATRGAAGRAPLTTACPPYFGLLRLFFGASRNDKTTGNNGKRNNVVQR